MNLTKQIPQLRKASQWFYGLSSRDQTSLKILAVAVLIFIVYALIWLPVQARVAASKAAAEQSYADLVWIKENEARARALKTNQSRSAQGASLSGQSLLSAISSSAQKFSIELQRFEPRGDDKVNVWLDRVSFNQMILWVNNLEQQFGVKAEQVNIDKADVPGQVSARLSLTI